MKALTTLAALITLAATPIVVIAGHGTPPDPVSRTAVTDVRPLMIEALQAPLGQAHGVLTGMNAQAITLHFKATSPIHIDVATLQRFAQAGCARLQVTFWQEGVQLGGQGPEAAGPRRQTIDFGINYCLDGRPPLSLAPEALFPDRP
ncbi:hypothetical protein [Roseateles flavus]|uniref:Uncharacterized protein n=1 Tax=Roseateles flavus TaxID=3149041 RepID=A0ABV0GL18_9BURK